MMAKCTSILSLLFISCIMYVNSQQVGTNTAEVHPPLTTYECTSAGCTAQNQAVVLDANWRWTHNVGGSTNCFSGTWNPTICPDPLTCAKACALEGANYESTYGITTSGSSLSLQFVTGSNQGSRVYLMKDTDTYQMLKLKNREFAFDVDVSQLECGMNGALYLVEMPADGGKTTTNKAGAAYGTGYCDAQCPQDVKFIKGQANVIDWNGSSGRFGSCCAEMDLWEANSASTAFTTHACTTPGLHVCNGTDCGAGTNRYNGVCDKDGCDFNSYRMGNTKFYGKGLVVDTNQKKVTVVTQFITSDGTDAGDLVEIRRVYVQNGKVIPNSESSWPQFLSTYDSITDKMCVDTKSVFGDHDDFTAKGKLKTMGDALARGMALVMSVWSDPASNMLWLDSTVSSSSSSSSSLYSSGASVPGNARGPCPATGGHTADLVSQHGGATVSFSNVKWGTIGSTYSSTKPTAAPTSVPSSPTKAPVAPTQPAAAPTKAPSSPTKAPVASTQPAAPTKAPLSPTKAPVAPTTVATKPQSKGPVAATAAPHHLLATAIPSDGKMVPNPSPSSDPMSNHNTNSKPTSNVGSSSSSSSNNNNGNVVLTIHPGSTNWWMAVAVAAGGSDANVANVEVIDSSTVTSWSPLKRGDWGYWVYITSGSALVAPITYRITPIAGNEVILQMSDISAGKVVNSGKSF